MSGINEDGSFVRRSQSNLDEEDLNAFTERERENPEL